MTVVSTTSRWSYNGDASTTVFPYDNLIFDASDLQVFVDGTLQTLNTDYTVSGVGDNGGGAVTFISGAPASGTNNVLIVRDVPFTQQTDLPEGGPFPSAAVEEVADKNTVLSQQLNDLLSNKSLALGSLDPATSIGRLPLKTVLAGMFLAFDSSGDPIAAAGTSADLGPVSSFINTLLDDADAATARATLGLGALAVLDVLTALSQSVALTGILSPAELTASQNNYNPTDLATASTLRLSSDASRTITGLQGGASGRVLVLHNVGSNNIVLADESASSTAANRFALETNIVLASGTVAALQYDITDNRWRCIAKPDPTATRIRSILGVTNQVIQQVVSQDGSVATGTTTFPFDDTIPQNTEGTEFLTVAITPQSTTNLLEIDVVVNIAHTTNGLVSAALFQDSTANALKAASTINPNANQSEQIVIKHRMVAGTTSATTFRVRAGSSNAGTMTFNGVSGARRFGGVMASSITVTELSA